MQKTGKSYYPIASSSLSESFEHSQHEHGISVCGVISNEKFAD